MDPWVPELRKRRRNNTTKNGSGGKRREVEKAKSSSPERTAFVMGCAFCKSNRETDVVALSHVLRDEHGKVQCPILRVHVCEKCGATGDEAHTRKYCPVKNQDKDNSKPYRTVRNATGNFHYLKY